MEKRKGQARFRDYRRQMLAKEGPLYEKWLARTIAGMIAFLTKHGYLVRKV